MCTFDLEREREREFISVTGCTKRQEVCVGKDSKIQMM